MMIRAVNAWFKTVPQTVTAQARALQPKVEALLPHLTGRTGIAPIRDHFYAVMPTREDHLSFLAGSIGSENVLEGTDNFREAGRIFAISRLPTPIFDFSLMETGQPYVAKPEALHIAHLAFCMTDRDGQYLDPRTRDEVRLSVHTALGLQGTNACAGLAFGGQQLKDIRKDGVTGVKFNFAGEDLPQVEVRFLPLRDTIAELQPAVLLAIRSYT
jgi:hypothetical protein